ncbi:MAG: ISAzo13 family transposase [Planctomycetaceae bacterium]
MAADSSEEEHLISCLEVRTAGDPDEADLVFTDLSPRSLAERLHEMGTPVGRDAMATWLDDAGIRRRQIRKDLAGGEHPDRNAQFERIAELIEQYESAGNPWFSINIKAKEHLGKLYRKGRIRGSRPFQAFDHDFPSWADGIVIPHGIFDRKLNVGHVNIGLSRDTTEFACDSFCWSWNRIGKQRYREASSILLTCDGGGSNSARKSIFKYDLERLSDSIGLPIRVAHYPPYCSKYNPIERRFFPHLGRACSGMLFDAVETVVALMRRAATSTGLRTTVNVIRRCYETGRNATTEMKQQLRIQYDELLPQWNYTAQPNNGQ